MRKATAMTKKSFYIRLIVTAIFGIIALVISLFDLFAGVNNFLMDSMYQKSTTVMPDIKIIAIDDRSLADDSLGNFDGWQRDVYATLLDKLNDPAHKPAVIGFDILFTGQKSTAEDELFAQKCAEYDNVVVGINLLFGDRVNVEEGNVSSAIEDVSYPYPALAAVTDYGFVNAHEDSRDSVVRKTLVTTDVDGAQYESFAYAIYQKYLFSQGLTDDRHYDANRYYRFKYSSDPGELYSVISFADVINKDSSYWSDFGGSIVLVGAYATGLQDQYYVPIQRGEKMHGVEIHANLIDAYAKGALQTEAPKALQVIMNTLITMVLAFFLYDLSMKWSSVIAVVCIGLSLCVQSLLDAVNIYMPFGTLMLFIVVVYVFLIIKKYADEAMKKRTLLTAFKKYVAPQVVDKAYESGIIEVNLGGVKRNIACLFVDIRGFTPLSESLPPESVVEILNEYLAITTHAILDNGGTLDKFIGDAAMAIFNAPFDLDDYLMKAVKTALAIVAESSRLAAQFESKYGKTVSYGIGINIGDAIVGNIGCDFRMDYTAIGDTVNTAARLESNARAGEILISASTYELIEDRIIAECRGELSLKGKTEPVTVYKILGLKEN